MTDSSCNPLTIKSRNLCNNVDFLILKYPNKIENSISICS